MKIKIKILSITLVVFLFNPQLFADIYEVNNNKIIILMESGVPLIDIRTKREWYETGVIKKSNLLTFFDKDGNYNVKEWMSKLKKIASKRDPVIIICSIIPDHMKNILLSRIECSTIRLHCCPVNFYNILVTYLY